MEVVKNTADMAIISAIDWYPIQYVFPSSAQFIYPAFQNKTVADDSNVLIEKNPFVQSTRQL